MKIWLDDEAEKERKENNNKRQNENRKVSD